jgi:hypothetical protein
MAKTVPYENIQYARAFINKFGMGELSVDNFDMFIIDQKLADDPGTSNPKDNAYRGFVQQRTAARRLINTAATFLNGESYQIIVEDAGEKYVVTPWASNAREITREVANKIQIYVDNRMGAMKALQSKTEQLRLAHSDDTDLAETLVMMSHMRMHGIEMQARIKGLVTQYNVAFDAVSDQAKKLIAQYDDSLALPAPTDE